LGSAITLRDSSGDASMYSGDAANAPIALIDLGDTLCECSPAVRAGLAQLRKPGECQSDETLVPLPDYLEARRRHVMAAPGFWRELRPRAEGFELLELLRDAGYRIHVLTKGPYEAPHVWGDKVAWCRQHLPTVPVTVTDDKASVHGDVLVDDWLPYVARWQARWPDGLAIVPGQPWNVDATPGPRLIRDDGKNRHVVTAALRRCREKWK
jgi:5'-nucleotidase